MTSRTLISGRVVASRNLPRDFQALPNLTVRVRPSLEAQPELDLSRSLLTLLILTPLVQRKAFVVSLDKLAIFLGVSGTDLASMQSHPTRALWETDGIDKLIH